MLSSRDDNYTKRQLLEKELYSLKEQSIKAEKIKLENEIYNSKALSEYEYINKQISDNNKKITNLQVNN